MILLIAFLTLRAIGIAPVLLTIAYLIAFLLNNIIKWVLERINLKCSFSSIILVLVFYGLSFLILTLIGNRVLIFIKETLSILPELFSSVFIPIIENTFNNIENSMVAQLLGIL